MAGCIVMIIAFFVGGVVSSSIPAPGWIRAIIFFGVILLTFMIGGSVAEFVAARVQGRPFGRDSERERRAEQLGEQRARITQLMNQLGMDPDSQHRIRGQLLLGQANEATVIEELEKRLLETTSD
jgi:hypothetical protein